MPDPIATGSIYYSDYNSIAPFFPGGDPAQPETFHRRYQYLVANHNPAVREKTVNILTEYNRSLGAGPASLANAAKLGQESTVAVVTGQQAGLLTGPLLTIYKAMTAMALADHYREELGVEVVPVFWIASEDHDYREINHLHFLGEKHRHKTVYLSYKLTGQPPMQWVPTGTACQKMLQDCLRQFRTGPYLKATEELLKDTLDNTDNICDWFGAILLQLLDGLVCINPMLPELRRLQQPVLQRGLEEAGEVNRILAANAAELEANGLKATVQKKREHTHLFLFDRGNRVPVLLSAGGFLAGDRHISFREMERLISEHPEQFSPDVILRPLTQEVLLPVLAYVAGPGEFDYWAQLAGVFEHFGLWMPPVYPRASLTLVEPEVNRLLLNYRLTPEQVMEDWEGALEERLKERDEVGLDSLFRAGQQRLEECYRDLRRDLGDPLGILLAQAWDRSMNRTLQQWQRLHRSAWREHRRRHRELINDFQLLSRQLMPLGKKQEAIYNLFSFYPVYGPELLKQLRRDLHRAYGHRFVLLGG